MSERIPVVVLLSGHRHDYLRQSRALLRSREATHHFNVEVVTDAKELPLQKTRVLLAASDHALQPGQASQLTDFVRSGGGLVLLHGTLATWADGGDLSELAGWAPTGPGPLTELVVRPDPSHVLTPRLGAELQVHDELYFSECPPAGAAVLLRASWRFTEQVVAYERGFGDGHFVHVGLGHDRPTYELEGFQKLIQRTLMVVARRAPAPSIGVGL